MILVHILNSSGDLTHLKSSIQDVSKKTINKVRKKVPVDDVDIVVYKDRFGVIPEIGIGGFTASENRIMISIDPDFKDIKESIKNDLNRIISHELYHVLRKYTFEHKSTLLESLINEGLADHFENEINNTKPNIWDTVLNEKELKRLTKVAEKDFDNYDYNHSEWFFGAGSIPHWAGYSIGYYLVQEFLNRNPEKSPSSIFKLSAKDFIN